MKEKNENRTKQELKNWIEAYYIHKGHAGLMKVMNYLDYSLAKFSLVALALMVGFVLFNFIAKPQGLENYLGIVVFVGTLFLAKYFFRRRETRYRKKSVMTFKQLEGEIENAKRRVDSLSQEEIEGLRELIKLFKNDSVGKEKIKRKLEDVLEFKSLRQWNFIQELVQDVDLS